MKKYIAIVSVLVVACLGLYLNRAYRHISVSIGEKNLANPTVHQTIVLPPATTTSTAKIVYAALGDSLTVGVGATAEQKTYPYLVAKLLAQEKNIQVTVANLGIPGATSADVLNQQVPQAAKLHPDMVILAVGINDMLNRVPTDVFEKNMVSIVNGLAGAATHITVINIPYLGGSQAYWPPYRCYFDWQTRRYNNFLNKALANKNVAVIDLYTLTHEQAFNDKNYYSVDGFHPSDEGYQFWSNIIYGNLNY
ncbi:MAG: SGNH/GDSL hydrolase family protein [Patescibacteria group bacterium]